MNPDPDPTPDPTPFFKDAKNVIFFFIFFSHNLATGTSSSVFHRIRIPQAQKTCVSCGSGSGFGYPTLVNWLKVFSSPVQNK
jgi:hypothetical protein